MPDNITSTVRLFADDTIAYLTVSPDNNTLQEDLNKLAKWEEKWMMQFPPDKCVVLTKKDHMYVCPSGKDIGNSWISPQEMRGRI